MKLCPKKPGYSYFHAILALTLAASILGGCSIARPPAKFGASKAPSASPERCASLDDRQSVWGAVGAGAGLLSGGAGLTTIATEKEGLKIGFAISSAVLGALAAGAEFFAQDSAKKYVSEGCGESLPDPIVPPLGPASSAKAPNSKP